MSWSALLTHGLAGIGVAIAGCVLGSTAPTRGVVVAGEVLLKAAEYVSCAVLSFSNSPSSATQKHLTNTTHVAYSYNS